MIIEKDGTVVLNKRERYELEHTCAYVKPWKDQDLDTTAKFCKQHGITYAQLQQRETMIRVGMKNIPDYGIDIFKEDNLARKIWNQKED